MTTSLLVLRRGGRSKVKASRAGVAAGIMAAAAWWLSANYPAISALLAWAAVSMTLATLAFSGFSWAVFPRSPAGRLPWPHRIVMAPFIAGAYGWNAYKSRGEPLCAEIAPRLFLGDRRAARATGWAGVIDMTCEYMTASSSSAGYRCFPWLDGTRVDDEMLATAASAIDARLTPTKENALPTVLVHCARGRWRSAQVAAYWLQTRRGLSEADAWRHLKQRRPCVKVPAWVDIADVR